MESAFNNLLKMARGTLPLQPEHDLNLAQWSGELHMAADFPEESLEEITQGHSPNNIAGRGILQQLLAMKGFARHFEVANGNIADLPNSLTVEQAAQGPFVTFMRTIRSNPPEELIFCAKHATPGDRTIKGRFYQAVSASLKELGLTSIDTPDDLHKQLITIAYKTPETLYSALVPNIEALQDQSWFQTAHLNLLSEVAIGNLRMIEVAPDQEASLMARARAIALEGYQTAVRYGSEDRFQVAHLGNVMRVYGDDELPQEALKLVEEKCAGWTLADNLEGLGKPEIYYRNTLCHCLLNVAAIQGRAGDLDEARRKIELIKNVTTKLWGDTNNHTQHIQSVERELF